MKMTKIFTKTWGGCTGRGADGEGVGNSAVGGWVIVGGGGGGGRGSIVRVSSTYKNRPSHHKYKSPKV